MSGRLQHYMKVGGQYEPEGLFLAPPLAGELALLQGWGEHPAHYAAFTYQGVPLKGHPGLDLLAPPGAAVHAADQGRVVEIGLERGGFERYVKLEHRWGESFYAHLGGVTVESGQAVERGQKIATVGPGGPGGRGWPAHLHFGVRLAPYNRFDGWGGFADPLPYLYGGELALPEPNAEPGPGEAGLPPMLSERAGQRRP